MLLAGLTAGALVAPFKWSPSRCARASDAAMALRLRKSAPDDSFEREMLARVGLADEVDDAAATPESEPTTAPAQSAGGQGAAPTPRSGTQAWGRWSHEGESVELEIALPEGTRAKELTCEATKDGVLRVELAQGNGVPVLSGRLALPVDRVELTWVVEQQDDDSKL
eukprot:2173590-Prymnesium_polylepis.1